MSVKASSLRDQTEREYGYRNGNSIVGRMAMASECMKMCLRVLKKGYKSRYDYIMYICLCAFIVSVIFIHTPVRSGRVGLTPLTDNVYWNSCIRLYILNRWVKLLRRGHILNYSELSLNGYLSTLGTSLKRTLTLTDIIFC